MSLQLTNNAIADIFNGKDITKPIIQVINIKPLNPSTQAQERFRAFISDGTHHTGCAMFATQLNNQVKSNDISTYSVIRLLRYVCNAVNTTKKIIIILECEVMAKGEDLGEMLGSPTLYDGNSSTAQAIGSLPVSSSSTMVKKESAVSAHPIASLTPYQNKWTICARVTNKSDVRTWSNSKGDGRLFSMDLLDESGEIRATAFNEQCDKFNSMVEVDKVYYISMATLKTANKRFSNLKNDYEMTFNNATQMTPCHDDNNIPVMQFEFVNIEQIESVDKDQIIDTIGICKSTQEVANLTQKSTGKELKKRDLQIVDDSGKEVRLTMWGGQAENFDGSLMPVIAIKGVKVSDFDGKSLSILSSSVVQINPDIREAHKLRAWYDNMGSSLETINISGQRASAGSGMGSNFKTLGQAIGEGLGSQDTADYYSVKATVTLLRSENCLYPACPSDNCNKKVIDQNNGIYRCEKCNREYDTFKWRLMLSGNIADCTDNVWATMFQEQAETLLGCTASELAVMNDMDAKAYEETFLNASFKEYIFKLRVKMDTYNDENRLRTSVVTVTTINPIDYCKKMYESITNMINN